MLHLLLTVCNAVGVWALHLLLTVCNAVGVWVHHLLLTVCNAVGVRALHLLLTVCFVDAGDLWNQRVVWVGVTEQGADGEEHCGDNRGSVMSTQETPPR